MPRKPGIKTLIFRLVDKLLHVLSHGRSSTFTFTSSVGTVNSGATFSSQFTLNDAADDYDFSYLLSTVFYFLLVVPTSCHNESLCQKLKPRQTQLQSGTHAQRYLLPSMPQIGAMWALKTAGSLLWFWKISWVPQREPSLINIRFSHSEETHEH